MKNFLQKITDAFLSLILPKSAAVRLLEATTPDELLQNLPPARPLSDTQTALFDYKDEQVKTLIWEIKYRGNHKLTETAATLLYDAILADFAERTLFGKIGSPLLVPIPASRERMRKQGFNQCERLVREIAKLDNGVHFTPALALSKVAQTKRQSHMKKKVERLANLRDSFIADASLVRGQTVILIDDVITTGTTVAEATRALKNAGAKKVYVYALAH